MQLILDDVEPGIRIFGLKMFCNREIENYWVLGGNCCNRQNSNIFSKIEIIVNFLSAEQDVTKKYIKKEKVKKVENPADFSVQKNLILSTPKAKIPKLSKY